MNDFKEKVVYSAAGGVVVDKDRVLVLFRPRRGEYRLPKGHIEEGEDAAQAAVREVTEESGCSVCIIADLGEQLVEFDFKDKHYSRNEHYFLMTLAEGDCGSGEQQFEPLWLSFEEALRTLSFEAEREWLRRAQEAWRRLQSAPEKVSGER